MDHRTGLTVGRCARSVNEVATELGCDWHTVNEAVIAYGEALVDHPGRFATVEALGLDEALMVRRGPRRRQEFSTQIVDVGSWAAAQRRPRPLWHRTCGLAGHAGQGVVCEGALRHLGSLGSLSQGVHADDAPSRPGGRSVPSLRLANAKLDERRRRVQIETLGHRGPRQIPSIAAGACSPRQRKDTTKAAGAKLVGLLRAGDPHGDVATMWQAKEAVRELYAHGDPDLALDWVTQLSRDLQGRDYPLEARSLGRTLVNWRHEIAAWHHAHVSNRPTEAANNPIKRVKRVAFGLREFRNYRVRGSSTPGSPTGRCSRPSASLISERLAWGISANHEPVGHAAFGQHQPRTFQDRCSGRPNIGRPSRSTRRVLSDVARAPQAGHCATPSRVSTPTHNPASSSSTLSTRDSGKPIIIAAMRSGSVSVCPSMSAG